MTTVRLCGPGCSQPNSMHAAPIVDWVGDWPISHGERDADQRCLCGHPDYLTCPQVMGEGSIYMLTIEATP